MYTTGKYPKEWNESFLHFIKKPNTNSMRPICLTSCVSKLFETLLKNKFQFWLEKENILPNSQSGFRKGQSTSDNLTNLLFTAEESFSTKKDLHTAFLDVIGAFDNVIIEILLEKLASIGCPTRFINFIKFLTFERTIITNDSENSPRKVYKGVPQGGVLSPILYCIYVSSILDKIPKSVKVSQFADDIALYCNRSTSPKSKHLLEKAIDIVYNNLYNIGLELSPQKTVYLHFNKNVKPGQSEIKIKGQSIKSSENARFLGIWFDYKLTFKEHINYVKKKCARSLNIVKFLRGTWWRADPKSLTIIYKSYVRSIIDYGCFIYFLTQQKLTESIEKIQYSAIRLSLGHRMSTPTNILFSVSKLTSIIERTKFLCVFYLNKIFSNTGLLSHKVILNLYKKMTNGKKNYKKSERLIIQCIENSIENLNIIAKNHNYNMYIHDYDSITHENSINISLGKSLQSCIHPNKIVENLIHSNNALAIFTDGSKSVNSISVGCACTFPELKIITTKSINKEASIFTGECIAIIDALDIALNHTSRNIQIFSDSLSALSCLKSNKYDIKTNPYIYTLKQKLHEFSVKAINNKVI